MRSSLEVMPEVKMAMVMVVKIRLPTVSYLGQRMVQRHLLP